jgi:predicted ATPase
VPLASIAAASQVPAAVAQALHLPDTGDVPLAVRIGNVLQTQHRLLVLDNFEQVLDAAPFVHGLLTAAPGVKVLVTSRGHCDSRASARSRSVRSRFRVPGAHALFPHPWCSSSNVPGR